MAQKKSGAWWDITTAGEWRDSTDFFNLWCTARDQTRFNRRLVNPSRVKKYNRRLLYLLGVAIWRRWAHLFPDPRCHEALDVAESFAEGTATAGDLEAACNAVDRVPVRDVPQIVDTAVCSLFWLVCSDDYKITEGLELLVDVGGYQAALDAGLTVPKRGFEEVWKHPAFIAGKRAEELALGSIVRDVLGNPFEPIKFSKSWRTDTAVSLARQMYDSREFSAMPILADALQDAGCEDETILNHCRGGGPHARGCWVIDGVLDKG